MSRTHPLKRRLLVEDFTRMRRADERRRYAASQRRGRIDANPHQIDAVAYALQRIPDGKPLWYILARPGLDCEVCKS